MMMVSMNFMKYQFAYAKIAKNPGHLYPTKKSPKVFPQTSDILYVLSDLMLLLEGVLCHVLMPNLLVK